MIGEILDRSRLNFARVYSKPGAHLGDPIELLPRPAAKPQILTPREFMLRTSGGQI